MLCRYMYVKKENKNLEPKGFFIEHTFCVVNAKKTAPQ